MKRKYLFRFLILILFIVVYYLYVSNKVLTEPITKEGFINFAICTKDSDCIASGSPSCMGCGCGAYVNKSLAEEYRHKISVMCTNYRGAVCGISACPKTQPSCKEGVCVGIARNYNILNHFIYRP